MEKTSNRFIATLAITNVLAFVVIFTLLWMIWSDRHTATQKNVIVTYSPSELAAIQPAAGTAHSSKTKPSKPSVNARDVSIITAVAKEVKSNIESSPRVPLNTDKALADDADSQARPNQITGAISDKDYVASYEQLAITAEPVKKEFSEQEVNSAAAAAITDDYDKLDHFNKVDVSAANNIQQERTSLAHQVAMVADSANDNSDDSNKNAAWKDYLSSLKDAEAERQNEMRTITVKRGDTLWKISARAYGTGFKYKRIFTANPHLTSPDSITVGETLRVPL